ncbi:cell envelope integrity protein CreD [Ottowia sp.]|uniref:cell envelope integrity protein CreD n=1 Tax=Ottowia sp. TaxID=1898956 RepID=UPI003A83B7A4
MSRFAAFTQSMLAKGLLLLLLLLLLCVPLDMVESLIRDRGRSATQATAELAQTHVGPQVVMGPVLQIPYVERWQTRESSGVKGQPDKLVEHSVARVALRFPDQWTLTGEMTPEERYRGLFTVLFYRLTGQAQGHFAAFDGSALERQVKDSRIEIGTPVLTLNVSDLRGLQGVPKLTVEDQHLDFDRQAHLPDSGSLTAGVHAPLTGAALQAFKTGQALPFTLELALLGQQSLGVVPLGGDNDVQLRSSWAHPSFGGQFLATKRTVSDTGFQARWRVAALTSQAREQLRAIVADPEQRRNPAHQFEQIEHFNVSFVQPVNVYSMADRAVRYGFLFVALTLLAVFMVELFARLRLHPVQYTLVGLSIAVFFLLLIALSEKLGFAVAYAGAAGASVALLLMYFSAVLRSAKRGALLGGFVAVLYGALYGLLASESHALMLGSLLVFGMLATLMLATRHVNWWALGRSESAQA